MCVVFMCCCVFHVFVRVFVARVVFIVVCVSLCVSCVQCVSVLLLLSLRVCLFVCFNGCFIVSLFVMCCHRFHCFIVFFKLISSLFFSIGSFVITSNPAPAILFCFNEAIRSFSLTTGPLDKLIK